MAQCFQPYPPQFSVGKTGIPLTSAAQACYPDIKQVEDLSFSPGLALSKPYDLRNISLCTSISLSKK